MSRRHARLLGDAPGSRVWTVKRAGKVRLAVPIPWTTGMIGESSAVLRHLRTPLKADPRSIARVVSIPYPEPTRGPAATAWMARICGRWCLCPSRRRQRRRGRGARAEQNRRSGLRLRRAPARGGGACVSQCYAVPPLERRERPVWQAGLALSGGASRLAARGPNHDTTPAALAAGAGRLAGEGAAKRHGPDRGMGRYGRTQFHARFSDNPIILFNPRQIVIAT